MCSIQTLVLYPPQLFLVLVSVTGMDRHKSHIILEVLLELVGLSVDHTVDGTIHGCWDTFLVQERVDFCNARQIMFISWR